MEDIREGQILNLRTYTMKNTMLHRDDLFRTSFSRITYYGSELNPCVNQGYSAEQMVEGITFENVRINGQTITIAEQGNIMIGGFGKKVKFVHYRQWTSIIFLL